MSGCGPTAAANIVWYLAQAHRELAGLYPVQCGSWEEYRQLMLEMFNFVRPGIGGVNDPSVLAAGLMHYAAQAGFAARSRILRVPSRLSGHSRPSCEKLTDFIYEALAADRPVAFLNYSNGRLKSLDSWHWVTVTAISPERYSVIISDHGRRKEISLYEWRNTSIGGGAMVAVDITAANEH